MTTARWWSQPVAAEGSTASEGIRRQLGKPNLDPLTVLVRETAQNTCDAALPDTEEIEFAVRLNTLSGNRLEAWREFLLPEPESSSLGLARAMSGSPQTLSISDRGTTGLGGPLRADEAPLPGERPDFVNFIRNVGERKSVDLGGGSYGFGKGILYNVSRCHVVVADSVCTFRGVRQRRLIGAALGDGYSRDGRRFTGRHWLGVPEADGHTRPLLDDEADEMADRLGMPQFAPGAAGTTVTVVDVDLGRRAGQEEVARTPEEAAEYIVSTMLWNLWPRMLHGRIHRLVCSVRRDGFVSEIPDPERLVELRPFVRSYRALDDPREYRIPVRQRAPSEIGRFTTTDGIAPPQFDSLLAVAAPFGGRAHHCARMRQADLVVDYQRGEAPADETVQRGAVFRASAEADDYFAEAEPPTHDDWVISGLRGTARGVVQLAKAFVQEQMQDRRDGVGDGTLTVGDTPLAALAGRLSGLLLAEGDLATASTPSGQGGGGGRRASSGPRFVEEPELVDDDDRPVIRAVVELPRWPTTHTVSVRPVVVLDNGTESEDEQGERPAVIGWRSTTSDTVVVGANLPIERESDRSWEVRVRSLPDAVIRLVLSVREDGAGR